MPGPPPFGPLLTRRGFLGSSAGLAAAAWLPRFPGAELSPGCDRIAVTAARWDQVVRPMLSSRYHRLHHCLFHYVRNNWPSLTPAQRDKYEGMLRDFEAAYERVIDTIIEDLERDEAQGGE